MGGGTSEGFVATGRYEEGELVRETARLLRRWTLVLPAAIGPIALGAALHFLVWRIDLALLLIPLVMGLSVVGFHLIVGCRRTARQLVLATPDRLAEVQYQIGTNGVTATKRLPTGETAKARYAWSMFRDVRRRRDVVVLVLDAQVPIVLPRRFFTDADAFARAAAAAARWVGGPADRSSAFLAGDTSVDAGTDAIVLRVQRRSGDIAHAVMWSMRRQLQRALLAAFAIWLLAIGMQLLPVLDGGEPSWIGIAQFTLFLLFPIAVVWAMIHVIWWVRLRRSPTLREPVEVVMYDCGIRIRTKDAWSETPWEAFVSYFATRRTLALDLGDRLMVLPRRDFPGEAVWRDTIQLVHRHIGACAGCGYTMRGVRNTVCPECGKPIVPPVVPA